MYGWFGHVGWVTDSGRLTHKVIIRPASSLAQDRESSLAETSILPTLLRSDVNKDLTFKAKDKDQTFKAKDQDKD